VGGIMRTLGQILRWILWLLTRPIVYFGRGVRYLALSFRFWVLLILAVIALLVAYYAVADRYTPMTTDAYVQAYVIQVAPQVAGQVMHVHVREGERVKAGALLFELDARPFEHKIAFLEAKLVEVVQQVKQLDTDLAIAKAERERLKAEADYASSVHRQEQEIYKAASTTERRYLDAVQKHKASLAALEESVQKVRRAEEALNARIGHEHALIAQVKAQLAEARLNLSYTRVYASCTGIITDLQLRDGTYVHTGQAALTLIDTSQWVVVANLRENSLARLEHGQPALIAFQGVPGRLLPGRVAAIGWGVNQGQGVPSGLLPDVKRQTTWVPPSQRFQVRLVLEDPDSVPLRVGMTGSVSVYTQPEGKLNEITRFLHEVIAWLYYL
jgi:multidrug resistance efflux pump